MATRSGTRRKSARYGERLAAIRKDRGVTQVRLAKALGVPQSRITDYERGILRLHADVIVGICRALRVSSDDLLGLR